jgi:hydrogenase/urease accessory protein HupE
LSVRGRLAAVLLAASLLAAAGAASAHLMPAGQGALRLDADSVYAVVSIPVATFTGFDDDGDGRMSLAEMNRHRNELLAQSARVLDFRDAGTPGTLVFQDLLIPHLHDPGAPPSTAEVIAMQRWRWSGPLTALSLRVDAAGRGGAPIALRASDGTRSEAVLLTAQHPRHVFFETGWAAFATFVSLGAGHILLGADHLLFLLTVLVVGAGWRYWLTVVTTFTLAHSITLTLAALGWLRVAPAVAEPVIAASIVLMAVFNLRGGGMHLRRRAALVFVCGLVHGLGFAGALEEIGGAGLDWVRLAGFNVGVELGQVAFVGAALGVLALLRRVPLLARGARLARGVSIIAALLGVALLVQLTLG